VIEIFDNKLSKEQINNIYIFCKKLPYTRGERDIPDTPPTGLVSPVNDKTIINLLLTSAGINNNVNINRSYVNLFLPAENPFYHIDNKDVKSRTLLYYVNNENLSINDGGETYFFYEEKIIGISPVSGRVVKFCGNILHKASSFRYIDRYTIALKWKE
jgi:hypothetical protein